MGFEFKTVEGLGEFFWFSGGEGWPHFRELSGAIINGDTLGTLVRFRSPGLETSHTELVFTKDVQSQILHLRNPNEGLTIIDSVDVNDEFRFYSHPGYSHGYYSHDFFSKGPFLVFPNDSIWLELFVREETLSIGFQDTLRIFARGINGMALAPISIPINFMQTVSVEGNENRQAKGFSLSQNYPNPFNPSTAICFDLPKSSFVSLKIYNLPGQEIETIVNETRASGSYQVRWTPKELSAGVYLYRIEASEFTCIKKLVFLK